MEANLKFNLDNLKDKKSHMRCIKAHDMALLLWKIKIELPKHVMDKFESDPILLIRDDTRAGIELVLNSLNELFEKHCINIEELTS